MSAVRISAASAAESRSAVRSCLTCAKAKAKCVRQLGKLSCERCARLNRECHTREAAVRKRRQSKLTRSEQLEKLESKIENLVHAFSNNQAARDELSPPDSQAASDRSDKPGFHFVNSGSRPNAAPGPRHDRGRELMEKICEFEEEAHRLKAAAGKRDRASPESDPDETIRTIEARMLGRIGEEQLDRYKRLMAHGCPFVKIPDDTSFEEAYRQRPMLMMAVALVASFHDLPKQQIMAKDFMRIITERIFFRIEKSIDILQALLIFITWNHPHMFWSQQVSTLLHLAIAQAVDLSIDRWPHAMDRSKFEHAAHKALHGSATHVGGVQKSTLEERRAVLGIFYLTSILSSTFRKIDAVKWTSWHDECLKVLEVAQEYDSDSLLVSMVKLQALVDDLSSADASNAPVHAYTKLYHRDMERLRESNPESDANLHLHSQFIAAEIYIWELTYADLFETKKPSRVMQRYHAEAIYRCIQAVKSNLTFFNSISPETYLTLPFQTFVTFAQAFMSMLRLAALEAEGWDVRDFKEHINMVELIEQGAKCYEQASKAVIDGIPVNNDIFTRWAAKLRWSMQLYIAKMGYEDVDNADKHTAPNAAYLSSSGGIAAANTPVPPAATLPMATDEMSTMAGSMQYLDDPFWGNFNFDFDFNSTDFTML